jgi:CheY-like chemotaxis protein
LDVQSLEQGGSTLKPIILLAEDDRIVSRLAEVALVRAGFIVLPATTGEEALELSRLVADLDALLTDVYMGDGMSGVQLAECLLRERPRISVLVMSANLEYQPTAFGRPLPFLPKPFAATTLVSRLRDLLAPTSAVSVHTKAHGHSA